MRWKSLAQLDRAEPRRIVLAALPEQIPLDRYAHDKALRLCAMVRSVFGSSLEWYGFTLGPPDAPERILDIGLPVNDLNRIDYTGIGPEGLAEFQRNLPADRVINGWIHSHGALAVHDFSLTDQANHRVVLDFVAPALKRPVARQELLIRDLVMVQEGRYREEDLAGASVALITDAPIRSARLLETVYGSFCYAVLIGDDGWHQSRICYREQGILSGRTTESERAGRLVLSDSGRRLDAAAVADLETQVRRKLRPNANPPPETLERL